MKVIDYFEFINECSDMVNDEGYESYNELLNVSLTKKDLINLIIEFTSIIVKSKVSLDILKNPFETGNDWDNVSNEDKLMNKSHLKIVH